MVKVTFSLEGSDIKNSESEDQITRAFKGYTGEFKKKKKDGEIIIEYYPMLLEEALTKINEINDKYIESGLGADTDIRVSTLEDSQ